MRLRLSSSSSRLRRFSAKTTMSSLQFAPWSSDIELAFYSALASLKINHDKLDDSARKVLGLYEVRPNDPPQRSCRMQIHGNALTTDEAPAGFYRAEGVIKNVNTLEEYKSLDKAAVQDRAARTIWDAIHDESIYSCPSLLNSFSAVCFADLKKYKFTYHFSFPAIHSDPAWTTVVEEGNTDGYTKLSSRDTTGLVETVQTWRYSVDSRQHGFFIAKRVKHNKVLQPEKPNTPTSDESESVWSIGSLSSYENGFFKETEPEDRFICFADPSTFVGIPGWPLRNLLVLIRQRWHLNNVQILCYRDTQHRRDQSQSIILRLRSPQNDAESSSSMSQSNSGRAYPPLPKVSGWERNEAGRLNNRVVDLAAYMNPERLADQAVDLNLKLIKWRIAPDIDLNIIKNTKCLLLGAGTLGSYVARNLMGWGVRKITFVDNAGVSFSNPVRQPLFDFKDCLAGGARKAHRAAEALTEIYPGVDAVGHVMSVPMAGHPILEEAKTRDEFEKLEELIQNHDVIFLLMDTRESRWLPTVMGKAAGKIVMNAALGFDTYVVMRHGLSPNEPGAVELGCYFCNDVVAPADSIKDATLDQQCTVTRPGIAPIASALLVELLVSILQHPLRAHAPATTTNDATSIPLNNNSPSSSFMTARSSLPQPSASVSSLPLDMSSSQSIRKQDEQKQQQQQPFIHPLGALPHQLRGFLSTFSTLNITGAPFPACSACSKPVLEAYKQDPWAFLKRALNERGWVEEISGLAELQRKAQELEDQGGMEAWEEDEEDEGEGELI